MKFRSSSQIGDSQTEDYRPIFGTSFWTDSQPVDSQIKVVSEAGTQLVPKSVGYGQTARPGKEVPHG